MQTQKLKQSFISLMKQCNSLDSLKCVHASMVRSHLQFHHNVYLMTNLISQYASLGAVSNAYTLFSSAPFPDLFLWNVMIRGFVDNDDHHRSFLLYNKMLRLGIRPDNFTFPFLLKACASLSDVVSGRRVHDHVVQFGYGSDVFVANSLVSMYGKCQSYDFARRMFDKMSQKNVVSWNAMISACIQSQRYEEGLSLFWRMVCEGFKPNRVSVLNAMACVRREQEASDVCRVAVDGGLDSDCSVQSATVGMYAKCGRIDVARRFFAGIADKDLVTWASMIEAYVRADLPIEALRLFRQMLCQSIFPDSVTFLSVIRASSILAYSQLARAVHGMVITSNLCDNQVTVETAVVDVYAKCGSLTYARRVFDRMRNRNVISWSTMISGYGMHGHGRQALDIFDQMRISEKPDHITFVSVLSACSHAGLVDEGWECFDSMVRDFGHTPRPEHYACMVDLLGRAGKLNEAQDFIERMPIKPDAGVWGSLLGACRIHSNVDLAEPAAKVLFSLDSENPGRYVILSNIYASTGKRKEADRIRTLMKNRGVRKVAGRTTIELKNKVYAFVTGDKSHPQTDLIYMELERLMDRIRQAGYVPDTNFVLHDVEEETKEMMLHAHSEKLAIVFGLLNSGPDSIIRIKKNLRVCGDCHTATKYISKVTGRQIIVRDAHRFHNLQNGICSCRDYW